MSLILNDIHLPMLIKSTLAEHSQYNTLPWNNLDQLSCLWSVFTKCKRNIRDGFRLENLSWRLWYRQSVLQKKAEPKTLEDIDISSSSSSKPKQLTRTKSLPDFSPWSQQKNETNLNNTRQKFYIPTPSFELDNPLEEEEESSSEEEEEEEEDDSLTFSKKNMINSLSVTALSNKPVSLLSDMLQNTVKEEESNSGLRRCQSRYCRLDQFFLNANNDTTTTTTTTA
ncbi:hypothetical protein BD770DRAFT_390542 [Pilaira anomala]|nr:hypothetical protein BD770DRAFT_390542 [Pilaira anomala]